MLLTWVEAGNSLPGVVDDEVDDMQVLDAKAPLCLEVKQKSVSNVIMLHIIFLNMQIN